MINFYRIHIARGDAYKNMKNKLVTLDDYMPETLPVVINPNIVGKAMDEGKARNCWVLAFVIGTKPCFNKVYGSVTACSKMGLPLFVIDSNQHYDANLIYGLKEFGFEKHLGINMQLRGDLAQKAGELFFKTSRIARWLKENWPGVTVVPVVNGDTLLCPTIPAAWMFARGEKGIQNEAGLRSMSPEVLNGMSDDIPLKDFLSGQRDGKWRLMRTEPFPEQWDTYVSAAACEHHMAPVEINRSHLLREGYPDENIHLIGGVVCDALELMRKEKLEKSIFEVYPRLAEGKWIRLDIHRKENLGRKRFEAIFSSLENLIEKGLKITLVMMNATQHAIEKWNLKERLAQLEKKPNFLATEVWPAYGHVVEFYSSDHCLAAWTDSGGVQEDMNLLGKPCLTSRFNTDRPETVMGNHGNILVPPINSDFITRVISGIVEDTSLLSSLANAKPLYGSEVGAKFASSIAPFVTDNHSPHRWSDEILGFGTDNSKMDITF